MSEVVSLIQSSSLMDSVDAFDIRVLVRVILSSSFMVSSSLHLQGTDKPDGQRDCAATITPLSSD